MEKMVRCRPTNHTAKPNNEFNELYAKISSAKRGASKNLAWRERESTKHTSKNPHRKEMVKYKRRPEEN